MQFRPIGRVLAGRPGQVGEAVGAAAAPRRRRRHVGPQPPLLPRRAEDRGRRRRRRRRRRRLENVDAGAVVASAGRPNARQHQRAPSAVSQRIKRSNRCCCCCVLFGLSW